MFNKISSWVSRACISHLWPVHISWPGLTLDANCPSLLITIMIKTSFSGTLKFRQLLGQSGEGQTSGRACRLSPLPPSAGTNQFKSAQPLALNPSVPSTQGGRTNSFNKMSSLLHCTSITVRKNLPSTQKCICTVCIFVNCHQWTTTENHLAIDNSYFTYLSLKI